jgi:integrase
VKTDARRGEIRHQSGARFTEYARAWIESYGGRTERGIREETRNEYRNSLERYAIPFFHRQQLTQIAPADVKSFAAHVARPGRSRNTVRLALAPLRAMLADAAEAGDIRQNPARGVRIGSLTKSPAAAPVKALKPGEAATLIAALPDPYRLLVRFLLDTGLRISEVAALRWSDVDFAAHRVRVERRYRDGRLGPPKSNAGRRVVPLPAPTSRLLWEARKTARNASDEGLVFPGKNGVSYLDATSVGRWFGVAAEKAGVPWATPHTCRHTCASWLLERRLTITAVQAWLGHANAAITLGFYAHFVPDELPASPFGDDLGTMPPKPAETSSRRTTPNTTIRG